jgi:hypothetical protein
MRATTRSLSRSDLRRCWPGHARKRLPLTPRCQVLESRCSSGSMVSHCSALSIGSVLPDEPGTGKAAALAFDSAACSVPGLPVADPQRPGDDDPLTLDHRPTTLTARSRKPGTQERRNAGTQERRKLPSQSERHCTVATKPDHSGTRAKCGQRLNLTATTSPKKRERHRKSRQ